MPPFPGLPVLQSTAFWFWWLHLLLLTPIHKVYSDFQVNISNGPSLLESSEHVIHQFGEEVFITQSLLALDKVLVKKEKQKLSQTRKQQ